MGEFRMPALGAGMDTGRVIEWHVAVGDEVHRGDIVALVETDKANIDVEVFEDGIIEELLVAEGTKVPVGAPLARLVPLGATVGTTAHAVAGVTAGAPPVSSEPNVVAAVAVHADGAAAAGAAPRPTTEPTRRQEQPTERTRGARVVSPLVRRELVRCGLARRLVVGSGPGGVVTRHDVEVAARSLAAARAHRASPYARCLAAAQGLDLATIVGSGPRGAIVARDLPRGAAQPEPQRSEPGAPEPPPAGPPAAAAPAAEPPPPDPAERARAMRLAIARAMERANRDIPHYYLGETVDVEEPLAWLEERNAGHPPTARILPAVLVLKATALALRDFGDFNGYWIDDAFQPGEGIHLGVAINLRRGGLLAPAIRDADQRTLDELMAALRDLVARTRAAGLRGSELTDPTITVSNLGDTGVETIAGVITPPQVALVGVGRITRRPWVVDDEVRVRRTMALSLAGDHRASDGHRGGRFLAAIAANLARPEML